LSNFAFFKASSQDGLQGIEPGRGDDVMVNVDAMRRGLSLRACCGEGSCSGEEAAAVQERTARAMHRFCCS
jgi:hypothetical protein